LIGFIVGAQGFIHLTCAVLSISGCGAVFMKNLASEHTAAGNNVVISYPVKYVEANH
jgi:uncharacterized protein YceK